MIYHIERETRIKIVLQYLVLSQSVFHWQFLFTYIFFASLKFGVCYITGRWDKFRVKNATLCLHKRLWHFFVVFHKKICVFIIFISFSNAVSNFCNKILTNLKPELMTKNCQCMHYHWTVCVTSKYNPHFDDYTKCKRRSQMMLF